jgi:hypothetical protein
MVGPEQLMKTENGAAELLEPLHDRDALIGTRRLWAGEHLVCEVGQRVDRRSWFVPAHREIFVEVLPAGLDCSRAVRCISPIDVQDARPGIPPWAIRRLCWPGQLLAADDPLALAFPDRFAEEPQ